MNEQVYQRLRVLLMDDGHAPGGLLDVDALACRLGVESGAVSGGLARLASEGLVVRVPDEGMRLRSFRPDEVRQLVETRLVTETAVGRLAAERAAESDVAALVALQRAAEAVLAHGGSAPSGREFHLGLARLTGNRELERGLMMVFDPLLLARPPTMRTPSRNRAAWREHGIIVRSLMARDKAAVEEAVTSHVESVERALLGALD